MVAFFALNAVQMQILKQYLKIYQKPIARIVVWKLYENLRSAQIAEQKTKQNCSINPKRIKLNIRSIEKVSIAQTAENISE